MSRRTFRLDDRGASEVAGYVLLVGLVLTASTLAFVLGTQAIGGLQAENDATAAQSVLENVDAELTTLAARGDVPSTTFDFSNDAAERLSVERGGGINVTIIPNSGSSCTAQSEFGTIRFEESSRVVAYEAGGIWTGTPGQGSTMISPPDVSFRGGSLDVSLVNISGHVNDGPTDATINLTETRAANSAHENALSNCDTVDEVEITVNSTFDQAWHDYLRDQTGVNGSITSPGTVELTLTSSDLPTRADMENNTVVNMTNPPYMDPGVRFGPDPGQPDPQPASDWVSVDKDANNSYLVSVESLTKRPPRISQIQELNSTQIAGRTRPPVDVVFVMDESGSMNTDSKIDDAKRAAENAVGTMNTSVIGDRAGIIGYTAYPNQRLIEDGSNDVYFSNDSSELNDTIGQLNAGGSTDISAGLNQSLEILSYREEPREAHVILLTDGRNEPGGKCGDYGFHSWSNCYDHFDERTTNAAHIAADRGITVHTFSFGSGADQDLLEDVADVTGGNFTHAATGDELREAFEATVGGFTSKRDYVTRTPLTTNFTGSSGEVHPPEIVGDTDPIAAEQIGGKTFLNVNDPTAPTLFSHSFRVDDGEKVYINATEFRCAEDGWRETGLTQNTGTRTLPVATCGEIVSTNTSLPADKIEFYRDGDSMTSLQTNDEINASLQRYNDSTGHFDLASNELIVNLNFEPDGEFENNLVLRYEIGLSEAEVSGGDVVNLQETVVSMG